MDTGPVVWFIMNLATTATVYTIPIAIYRYAYKEEPLKNLHALGITMLFGFFSHLTMTILIYLASGEVNYNIAALWLIVNYAILMTGENKKESQDQPKTQTIHSTITTQSKQILTKESNSQQNTTTQPKNNIKTSTKRKIALTLLILTFIIGEIGTIIYYQNQLKELEGRHTALYNNYNVAKKEAADYQDRATACQNQIDLMNQQIVFITPTGKSYHTYSCHYWRDSDRYLAYNVKAAQADGYKPCKECKPPQ